MKFSPQKFWPLLALPFALIAALAIRAHLERPIPPDPYPSATWSLIEPNLYVGARTPAPPPNTIAVLSLSYNKDLYKVPFHQYSSIPDGKPGPSLDWLNQQVAFVDAQQKAKHVTFIHCDAGMSRSALVTTAYLMFEHHWTRDQALAFLKEKRPVVSPNSSFMDLLLEYQKSLQQNP